MISLKNGEFRILKALVISKVLKVLKDLKDFKDLNAQNFNQ